MMNLDASRPSRANIKAILFDLDQTLIDFMKMKRMCVTNAVDAMIDAGLKMSREKAEKKMFGLYDKYGIEYQKIFQAFSKAVLGKVDFKIIGAGISAYRQTKIAYVVPYPHVIPTLTELKNRGLKLVIISDAPRIQAWIRLCDLKLHHLFDFVITIGDVKRAKPSALPFKKALETLGMNSSEVLVVGDNPKRDILGAKKLGIKTVLARYGTEKGFADGRIKADYEINDIADLLKILR